MGHPTRIQPTARWSPPAEVLADPALSDDMKTWLRRLGPALLAQMCAEAKLRGKVRNVILKAARGCTDEQIAKRLGIRRSTVPELMQRGVSMLEARYPGDPGLTRGTAKHILRAVRNKSTAQDNDEYLPASDPERSQTMRGRVFGSAPDDLVRLPSWQEPTRFLYETAHNLRQAVAA